MAISPRRHFHPLPKRAVQWLCASAALAVVALLGSVVIAADPTSPPPSVAAPPADSGSQLAIGWLDVPAAEEGAPGQKTAHDPIVTLLDAASQRAPESTSNQLKLTFEMPIWLSGISGKTGVRGFVSPVNASFTEILSEADSVIGLGGRVEADYGPWIFAADGLYMKLGKDNIPLGPARLNFTTEMAIADVDIMYQVGKWSLTSNGEGGDPALSLAGGVGARYMHVGLQLNTQRGRSRDATEDWADPVAAGQVTLDLTKNWQLLARGDIGAGSSDLTWQAGAYVAYQFALGSSATGAVKLGYEAISEDFHNGSGNQEFVWDAILHGPVIVLAVKF